MSDVLREFQQLLTRAGESGSSIEMLLGSMPPVAATHLRLCAIPHEFNPSVLRAMTPELDLEQAKARYEELSRLSCVIVVPDGLALHDATRAELFAQWLKADHEAQFRAVSGRLVTYYEALVGGVAAPGNAIVHARMFHLLGGDPVRGFAEFEALCRHARRENRWPACANLIRLVHEYDPVLTALQAAWLAYHEGKLAIDIEQWDRAESLLRPILDDPAAPPTLIVKTRLRLGYLAGERGGHRAAVEHYQRALALVDTRATDTARYDVLRSLAEAYRELREYDRADELLKEALEEARAADKPVAVADIYNSLGTLHWRRRELPEAATAYHSSLELLLGRGRRMQSAQVYNNLGILYAEQLDWGKAEDFYRKSLEIKQEVGDGVGQARTLVNLVQIHRSRNDIGAAIEACTRAIRLFEAVRHPLGLARAKRMLGRLYLTRDADVARRALTDAAELFERSGADAEAQETRAELGAIGHHVGLPWWAWLVIGVFGALVLLVIILAVAFG